MPSLALISTAFGPVSGGTSVTIHGTGFLAGAVVRFGANDATNVVVVSATQITCNTPPGAAGDVDVTVQNLDGQSGSGSMLFTYVPPPTITAVAPASGPLAGGDDLTITGTGFRPGAALTIGGNSAVNVNVLNETTIECESPPGSAGDANVVVTNLDGQASSPATFTYVPAPTVSSVSPAVGPEWGGTAVTITGTGFMTGAAVTFDDVAATNVNVSSPTSLTCNTPAGAAGPADVVVTNPDGQESAPAALFDYVAPPTVSSVSPSSGPEFGGTSVTITGTGFASGASVTFDGASATNVHIASDTTITCNTPVGSAGPAEVVVTNLDNQQSTPADLFLYIAPPAPTSVSPATGPEAGGTAVTISGTCFLAGATVTFDGAAAGNVNVISDTSIQCVTPPGSAGLADVVVTNLDGQANSPATLFNYIPAPSVSAVSPAVGPASGGTPITLTGATFLPGATVTIGGASATNVVVVNDTTITCNTPAGTAGPAAVVVTNLDLQSSPPADLFEYIPPPTVTSVTNN